MVRGERREKGTDGSVLCSFVCFHGCTDGFAWEVGGVGESPGVPPSPHPRPVTVNVLISIYVFRDPTCKMWTVFTLLSPLKIVVKLSDVIDKRCFKSYKYCHMVSCSDCRGRKLDEKAQAWQFVANWTSHADLGRNVNRFYIFCIV